MNDRSLKTNIYKRRREAGYSQEKVAELLKISVNSYRKIERGNTSLISERVAEIATILGVSDEELILGYKSEADLFEQKIEELRISLLDKKESEISQLNTRISFLESKIKDLEQIIEDKNVIIKFLQKKR